MILYFDDKFKQIILHILLTQRKQTQRSNFKHIIEEIADIFLSDNRL